jgi:hypothetical protein
MVDSRLLGTWCWTLNSLRTRLSYLDCYIRAMKWCTVVDGYQCFEGTCLHLHNAYMLSYARRQQSKDIFTAVKTHIIDGQLNCVQYIKGDHVLLRTVKIIHF